MDSSISWKESVEGREETELWLRVVSAAERPH